MLAYFIGQNFVGSVFLKMKSERFLICIFTGTLPVKMASLRGILVGSVVVCMLFSELESRSLTWLEGEFI